MPNGRALEVKSRGNICRVFCHVEQEVEKNELFARKREMRCIFKSSGALRARARHLYTRN